MSTAHFQHVLLDTSCSAIPQLAQGKGWLPWSSCSQFHALLMSPMRVVLATKNASCQEASAQVIKEKIKGMRVQGILDMDSTTWHGACFFQSLQELSSLRQYVDLFDFLSEKQSPKTLPFWEHCLAFKLFQSHRSRTDQGAPTWKCSPSAPLT